MSKHNFWGVLDVSRIKIGDFFIFYLQQQWIYHRWVNFLYDTPRALEDERVFFGWQLENQKNYLWSKENFLFSTCTLKTTVATCRGQNVGAVGIFQYPFSGILMILEESCHSFGQLIFN
jgi:hypothetical protein